MRSHRHTLGQCHTATTKNKFASGGDGMFLADAESYGADKLWCLLKPISIELDDGDEEPETKRARTDGAAGSSS